VAIVQISQITNRKGLSENLPQLAGAELGWSTDTRQLWIGNGTLEEGAPVVGNTEILTEFSDILNLSTTYTYEGLAAGYAVQTGPTPGTPITLSLQNWLDQWATVLDFGAVGDGIVDCTDAINRALYQLFCRQSNPQIRRALFFPAGVYRVTGEIKIPSYATLYGEGINNSVIQLDSSAIGYTARTADSLQQTGDEIGTGGATPPTFITISNMGFQNANPAYSVFLLQDATNCRFEKTSFVGPKTTSTLNTNIAATAAFELASSDSYVCRQNVADECIFTGTVYGVNTNQAVTGITIANSQFDTLYQGAVWGLTSQFVGSISGTTLTVTGLTSGTIEIGQTVNGSFVTADTVITGFISGYKGGVGSYTVSISQTAASEEMTGESASSITGVRLVHNFFDNIYVQGVVFGTASMSATGYNVFYDVGNHFLGAGYPASDIIEIQSDNNVSIGDMFARNDADAGQFSRINIDGTLSIATTNGAQLQMGTWTKESGKQVTLQNNFSGTVFSLTVSGATAFAVNYTIFRSPSAIRTGTISAVTAPLSYNDEYIDNSGTGIILSFAQVGSTLSLNYVSSNAGTNATINYTIAYYN